jgi:hypothetical protein
MNKISPQLRAINTFAAAALVCIMLWNMNETLTKSEDIIISLITGGIVFFWLSCHREGEFSEKYPLLFTLLRVVSIVLSVFLILFGTNVRGENLILIPVIWGIVYFLWDKFLREKRKQSVLLFSISLVVSALFWGAPAYSLLPIFIGALILFSALSSRSQE